MLDLVDADDQVLDFFLVFEANLLQVATLLLQHQVFLGNLLVLLLQTLDAIVLSTFLPHFSHRYRLNRALSLNPITLSLRMMSLLWLREL